MVENKGMALIKGKVTLLNPNQNKLDNEMRLPNMGWSTIKLNNNNLANILKTLT